MWTYSKYVEKSLQGSEETISIKLQDILIITFIT